jgi:hypothetical protein
MDRKFCFFALYSINIDVWKTGYEDEGCMKLAWMNNVQRQALETFRFHYQRFRK